MSQHGRRRRIRLVVPVVIACVVLTAVVLLEQQRPVIELERAGASVVQNGDGTARTISFCSPDAGDAHLRLIAKLPTVTTVNLARSSITAAGLQELAALAHLNSLDLSDTVNGSDFLAVLADFPDLRTLQLRRCAWLTDEALAPLAASKTLECLMIAEAEITDASLERLTNCPSLKSLGVDQCPRLTNAGVAVLAERSRLESVSINGCAGLTDAGVLTLAGLKTLSSLSACGIPMRRPILQDLAASHPHVALSLDRFEIPELAPLVEIGARMELDGSYQVKTVEIDDRWHDPAISPVYSLASPGDFGMFAGEPESRPVTVTSGMLEPLLLIPEVSILTLNDLPLPEEELAPLCALTNLKRLEIRNVPLTDDRMSELACCKTLQALWLQRVPMTGEGVAALEALPGLKELSLLSDQMTQAGIDAVTGLDRLETLALGDVSSTSVVSQLCRMPKLQKLALVRASLTTDDVRELATAPHLKQVELLRVDLRGDRLLQFADVTGLESLYLAHCDFDRESLDQLRSRRPDMLVHGTFRDGRRPLLTPMMPERRHLLGGIPLFVPHAPTAIH